MCPQALLVSSKRGRKRLVYLKGLIYGLIVVGLFPAQWSVRCFNFRTQLQGKRVNFQMFWMKVWVNKMGSNSPLCSKSKKLCSLYKVWMNWFRDKAGFMMMRLFLKSWINKQSFKSVINSWLRKSCLAGSFAGLHHQQINQQVKKWLLPPTNQKTRLLVTKVFSYSNRTEEEDADVDTAKVHQIFENFLLQYFCSDFIKL